MEAQKDCIETFNLKEKSIKILIQDVKTRWNSTHALIDRYILLYRPLEQTVNDLRKILEKNVIFCIKA